MKKLWDWLYKSSENPEQVALTVKGFLNTIGGVVLIASPLFHLNIGQSQIDLIVQSSVQIVITFYTAFAAATTIYGIIRKIINTFRS